MSQAASSHTCSVPTVLSCCHPQAMPGSASCHASAEIAWLSWSSKRFNRHSPAASLHPRFPPSRIVRRLPTGATAAHCPAVEGRNQTILNSLGRTAKPRSMTEAGPEADKRQLSVNHCRQTL
ncbi:hypothetical protein CBM2592_B40247 [Cupriavidus taiwanensis]|nr:hypothetical protein CBM2592_B40247 [Cupriavidus taiwanensis]SOY72109.1 hypothetical protein CBM2588_B40064 [Cupriavidus taiwanensis]SOZ29964.1 hypothetical protein CBM2608_B30272 [Cupriavidus taiwanensis]SOZ88419.1 hypothetical protein CBM2618_B50163 [Cupriavidus taiwanensis]SOZ95463.1 hypothetical protein CBM2621_B50156 [Cupriavidus taiwanensis]